MYVQTDLEDQIEEEYASQGRIYNRTNQQPMATITTSGVLADLKSGYTRFKKDDKGFGSIEEKYGLTVIEVKELFQTESLKARKTVEPRRKLEIIDDLAQPQGDVIGGILVGSVGGFNNPSQALGMTAQEAGRAYDNLITTGVAYPEALAVLPDVEQKSAQSEELPEPKVTDSKDSIFA